MLAFAWVGDLLLVCRGQWERPKDSRGGQALCSGLNGCPQFVCSPGPFWEVGVWGARGAAGWGVCFLEKRTEELSLGHSEDTTDR